MKYHNKYTWIKEIYDYLTQTDDPFSFIDLSENSTIENFWLFAIFKFEDKEKVDFFPDESTLKLNKNSFSV